MSLPLHWSADGLPVGVHLAAAFGNDEMLMSLSAQIEQAAPWADRQLGLIRAGGVRLRLSKIGKECHHGCAIFKELGDCIMPREGIFAKVIRGGEVKAGDIIRIAG